MTRTCTAQVNLDFTGEADMVAKLRMALKLQPVATALFSNSPFAEGRAADNLDERAAVWLDVDPARTGSLPIAFEDGFGFERYVDYALDVPMYFVYRDGTYIDLAGQSFRTFMTDGIPQAGPATIGDFADHMTTAFTDVRVKRFLEMRGADAGSPAMMLAQSAFWVGLLYDDAALAAALSLVHEQPWEAYRAVRGVVPRLALGAPWGGGRLRDLAVRAVAIARDGLRARARLDAAGRDESVYLAPLEEIAAGAPTQAERWLARFHGSWGGDASRIFAEAAI